MKSKALSRSYKDRIYLNENILSGLDEYELREKLFIAKKYNLSYEISLIERILKEK